MKSVSRRLGPATPFVPALAGTIMRNIRDAVAGVEPQLCPHLRFTDGDLHTTRADRLVK
jgi:hypothetical protein